MRAYNQDIYDARREGLSIYTMKTAAGIVDIWATGIMEAAERAEREHGGYIKTLKVEH